MLKLSILPQKAISKTQLQQSLCSELALAFHSAGLAKWLKGSSVAPTIPTSPCTLHSAILNTFRPCLPLFLCFFTFEWAHDYFPNAKACWLVSLPAPPTPPFARWLRVFPTANPSVASHRTWMSNCTFPRPCIPGSWLPLQPHLSLFHQLAVFQSHLPFSNASNTPKAFADKILFPFLSLFPWLAPSYPLGFSLNSLSAERPLLTLGKIGSSHPHLGTLQFLSCPSAIFIFFWGDYIYHVDDCIPSATTQ